MITSPILARLLLMIPVIALCVYLNLSDLWVLGLCVSTWVWTFWLDTVHRDIPVSPSNMLVRAWIWFTILVFLPLHFIIGNGSPAWSEVFWEGFGIAILIGPFCSRINSLRGNYWLNLPWPWNPNRVSEG